MISREPHKITRAMTSTTPEIKGEDILPWYFAPRGRVLPTLRRDVSSRPPRRNIRTTIVGPRGSTRGSVTEVLAGRAESRNWEVLGSSEVRAEAYPFPLHGPTESGDNPVFRRDGQTADWDGRDPTFCVSFLEPR